MGTLLLILLLPHCSTERTPTSLPGAHPNSWMDKQSVDFHGQFVLVDGTVSCARCHGINQPGGKSGVSCLDCHGTGQSNCLGCHGGTDNSTSAPPAGLRGERSDTSLAVGAHTSHLDSAGIALPVGCNACHEVPLFLLSPSHLDSLFQTGQIPDSIAEIRWHGISDPGGAGWNRMSRTCAGTYCHGNFSGGDITNRPIWTAANQAVCGSCHDVGFDPAQLRWKHDYHVTTAGLACADCHASVTDDRLNIINPGLHVNGLVDTLTRDPAVCLDCHGFSPEACTRCHGGTDNMSGAPPLGLRGETSASELAVGAHTTHMEGGDLADAFACSDCHLVPSDLIAAGHLGTDSIAEMNWSALAGRFAGWDRQVRTCFGTYCHGNFSGGNSTNAPVWTAGNQAGCGSCHDVGLNPQSLSGQHKKHISDENFDCMECHQSVVSQMLVILDKSRHVNGLSDVSLLKGGIYQNGACSGLSAAPCHDTESWFED